MRPFLNSVFESESKHLQLNTANDELNSKNGAVSDLEGQLETLRLSHGAIQAEVEAKNSQTAELESSKAALEAALQEAKDELAKLEADYEGLKSTLDSSKEEVCL